jgi:spore coat protein U-like protein
MTMRRLRPVPLAVTALLASFGGAAHAATCDLNPQGANFGTYDPLSPGPLDTVGNVNIRCDGIVALTVSLGPGNGSYDERRMLGGGAELAYNLYTDAARTIVWGDGSGSTGNVSINAQNADIPVYGRMPGRQPIPAAAYADTIVVTITY